MNVYGRISARKLLKIAAYVFGTAAILVSGLEISLPALDATHCPLLFIQILKGRKTASAIVNMRRDIAPVKCKVGVLLEHIELSDLQKRQFYDSTTPEQFEKYILSPIISPEMERDLGWRRLMWEHVYPRIRNEHDPAVAATMVARYLRQRVTVANHRVQGNTLDLRTAWESGMITADEFEVLYVAALRSVGIGARINVEGKTEFLENTHWQLAPRPLVESLSIEKMDY